MGKSEKVVLCLDCKRIVEKYSDVVVHSNLKENKTPCAYCNGYDDVVVYTVSKKVNKAINKQQKTLCLKCHKDMSRNSKNETKLIKWQKEITCDLCKECLPGGVYEVKS